MYDEVGPPGIPGTRDTNPQIPGHGFGHDGRMPARPALQDRHLVALAAVLAAVSVLCCAVTPAVQAALGDRASRDVGLPSDLVLGSVWPFVGALVVRAQPRNPVGWWMLVPPWSVAAA